MKKLLLLIACLAMLAGCGNNAAQIQVKKTADSLDNIARQRESERKRVKDSIERVAHRQSVENSIKIINYHLGSPNSAGGVDAHFRYTNLNDKTIKYLTWEGYPINDVGDAVSCTIRDYSSYSGKDTGPIKKGQSSGYGYWDCAWYNYHAKKLILTGVFIEYMDGSTLDITSDEDLYIIGKKKNIGE